MRTVIQQLRLSLPIMSALTAEACAAPSLAPKDITQCFALAGPQSPPKIVKGDVFILPGALLLLRRSDLDAHDPKYTTAAFHAGRYERIVAQESMYDPCGIHIAGWVWLKRLGRRYLEYSAF